MKKISTHKIITKQHLIVVSIAILVVLLAAFGMSRMSRDADAASAAGFNAGNIIDDAVFTNYNSMSVTDIQKFLKQVTKKCYHNGVKPIPQWVYSNGNKAPFTCLGDYKVGGKSAAQIIYNASQKYRINPQVFLVLLEKEQVLVSDSWPVYNGQYKSATGYGCPDTAPCNSKYFGLVNQLDWSGKMFRAIMDGVPQSQWYTPYVVGKNYIQYNPNSSCGGSTVNIQNRATQALYNYTPYQPNKAALAAGYGSAACGAYGNRNFYLLFTNWFGTVNSYKGSRVTGPGSSSAKLESSSSKKVTVKFKNTGKIAWYDTTSATAGSTKPVVLVAKDPSGGLSDFNDKFATATRATENFSTVFHQGKPKQVNKHIVYPGQVAAFTFNIDTADGVDAGSYKIAYQPVIPASSGDDRIDITSNQTFYLNVSKTYAAERQRGPGSSSTIMYSSTTKQAIVRFKNTGLQPWYDIVSAPANNERPAVLGTSHIRGGPSGFNGAFATAYSATESFAAVYNSSGAKKTSNTHITNPGETAEYRFMIKAPSLKDGQYTIAYQPVIPRTSSTRPQVKIGSTQVFYVNVQEPRYNAARWRGKGASSTSMRSNSTKQVSIHFTNTGNMPWYDTVDTPAGQRPVVLTANHANGSLSGFNGSFVTSTRAAETFSAVYKNNGKLKTSDIHVVKPGETAVMKFDIQAPSLAAGPHYRIAYRLVLPAGGGSSRVNVNDTDIYYVTID